MKSLAVEEPSASPAPSTGTPSPSSCGGITATKFWSYDDPEVLTTEMNYIKARGLGGGMAWSMEGEDANATLSKTIFNALR